MAGEASSVQTALHANEFLLVELGGTRIWRTNRKANTSGVFHSVPELIDAIYKYIDTYNEDPQPLVWTAKVEDILQKVSKCKAILQTVH